MTIWPDPERQLIVRYLAGLDLHTTKSRTYYKQALNGFQDVAERHAELGMAVLVAWLEASSARWAATTRLHRTRIIDRFLDHLLETGAIERHPVVILRDECNIKQCMPVWRALASRDPGAALANLRQPKPFGSVLGEIMAEHVALMRNRGYKYASQPMWLLRFDRFLQLNPALQDQPIGVMLEHWSAAKRTRNHANECEKLKRVLAKILRHRDPSILPRRPDPRPAKEVAKQWRRPHIYTPADVRRMLDIARSYPSPRAPLRPLSIYTMLLLAYCAGLRRSEVARLDLGDVDLQRGTITIGTRNCRLAAIRSFFHFVATRDPALIAQCVEILNIPVKRAPVSEPCYLDPAEVTAILAQPDRSTPEGMRDHALLSFLYNSGARIQEALDLCPEAIRFESPSCVRLVGKGRKERICPLWPETVMLLKKLLERQPRAPDQRLFVNRYGEPLSASGVRFKLAAYVRAATETAPTLRAKHVTPHAFRHATAVHLISAGVDVTVIRSWLGHVSLDTTNHYARANLETKRKALEQVAVPTTPAGQPSWKRDASVLAWLDAL